ncbi:isoamylase early set domain-containing protein [Nitratifractor sp.]|uniref:isoamylase early set domain-containing protein n=1 Tax=Nitratifractor sp. TaxID=2268144 RepID=UPI0025E4CD69|nr:isoamylase early set domain-containing protein [Nitratifractor sp.]
MLKITKRGKKAWVTFTLPDSTVEKAFLKGSWNGWKAEAMKRKKSGEFYLMKILPTDTRYEFGYLADGEWRTDEELPDVQTPFGSRNSVLEL